ncbi:ABC transporter ATP-binding protein [Niallia sp. NCCP-28]|uniref:ABC transporter ATP-binding protein n=1 Tax=Niallia sp. NCCP-28 TaxID=2934712 RepID=UPI00208C5066|nr:dipeptide/oligopeptide/nickel ABC transporter ATP-binding protein [Niallia sp. NCCP-28]GKU80674.1 hypothetical protein NCCP28_00700 [Niallia sp. NCCP-28]
MILEVNHLSAKYQNSEKMVLNSVSFLLEKGKKLGIVGESGSGKSTLTRILAGFHPYVSGKVYVENRMVKASIKDRNWLSKKMQLIFQNPLSSLDPRQTVRQILEEPLVNFSSLSAKERKQKINAILKEVNLQTNILEKRSAALSGGQAQRICIARSLLANPEILICDEPVTSLDMTTQIKIIQLLKNLVEEKKLSIIFVSHDISLVLELCDEVLVLKEGRTVDYFAAKEWGNVERHPYTKELIESTKII